MFEELDLVMEQRLRGRLSFPSITGSSDHRTPFTFGSAKGPNWQS
jgi:hypothetical protein